MKYAILSLFFLLFAALPAVAQESFRVGDTVETNDGRVCKILSITGSSAKVICGVNRSDVRVYSFGSITSRAAAEAKREQERQRQNAVNQPQTQTLSFNQGDTVQTPDGRTGKIESIKNGEMAKVSFGGGDAQYFMLKDLKVVQPPQPTRNKPVENFRVGDVVVNKANRQVRINSISGDSAVVQYGVGKYNVNTVKLADLISLKMWERRQAEENQGKIVRAGFEDETKQFLNTINIFANIYNPKYNTAAGSGFQEKPATYEQWRKDLDALAAVCQKYPNLTNPPFADESTYTDSIRYHPADWCQIAEQRDTMLKKMKIFVGNTYAKAEFDSLILKMDKTMNDPEGIVTDQLQTLLYDRAAFEKKNFAGIKQKYIEGGAAGIPAEVSAAFEKKVAEFKTKIEADAEARTWKQPEFKDAALEGMVKAAYPKQFPGIKIFKTGMTWATWKNYDDKTYVGSDSNYRYYKLEADKNRYKRGQVLIKMPNQPYCQLRDFSIIQTRNGAAFGASKIDSLDVTGIFMKCP